MAEPQIESTKPNLRPEVPKELSPRERAELRAKQIMEDGSDAFDDGIDEFFIAATEIPDGWTYEWKTDTVLGKEDPSYKVQLARKGWEPVPASRHPNMMPSGYQGKTITRGGLILMERPESITQEARDIERRRASLQVRVKEEQLSSAPSGQFERANKGQNMANISKGFEAIQIPKV